MRRRALGRVPLWRVMLCLAAAGLATSWWYASRTVRPHCAISISAPPADLDGRPFPIADWKRWTPERRTDLVYWFAVGAGRCKPPEPRWRQWLD
ncbi:hypothetical protein ACIBL8_18665 [Streptomyces sp. NPDC050523]|uniref:hypothetical protein n=1 Tax=Streptomyces sp. NPDC050523 TaxID=3365622 RepID=UPI003797A108